MMLLKNLSNHFLIKHVQFTTYYPQGNGQEKSTNKFIIKLITKFVSENKVDWDELVPTVFFSYKITYKIDTRYTPY
jgi:hypothetical protein